ncbi:MULTISPECIES: protein phosphatase 2C domain-containing protein [Bacillaceae]|uniref:protein phosphatase 2C domain-containing protein n=1 Tax=Bacillaceae TaxID=186817 RepID=UPI001C577D4B|nr:protein phosphatase 2C domain-containing protein [Rossellomorea sp. YZS02]MBW3112583.1 protein phosphatase 2C domain-containing protein [Bacillus sp. MCCB 382]MDX8344583.1 protein phosphatase 2C domain-containing protein [Rossellomorea sp. YZS02]
MKLHHVTIKGDGTLNEDALIINEQGSLFGVADGVSSFVPFTSSENLTGGYIASHMVKEAFESLEEEGKTLFHTLVKVNESLHEKMYTYGIDINRKEKLWGTAVAVIRLMENGVEFIQTGDCMILAVYKSGEVRSLTRLQVEHLEEYAIEIWRKCIRRGVRTRDDIMPHVKEQLIANRKMSNTVEGYGVLNGEEEAADYFEYGKINKVGLTHLILMTDGLFLPTESIPEGESYWEYTANNILRKGIEQYAQDLITLEESDPECITYPRFKKSDDKAGIVLEFC